MLHTRTIFVVAFSMYIKINAVPPEACFANFRWEDCGRPPRHVLYYWKPGSRCEVGIWRGCLPNINMFHDEYECVATCIFTARATQPPLDFHIIQEEAVENVTEPTEVTVEVPSGTVVNETTTVIITTPEGNVTIVDAGNESDVAVTSTNTSNDETNATISSDMGNTTDYGEANKTSTNSTVTDPNDYNI